MRMKEETVSGTAGIARGCGLIVEMTSAVECRDRVASFTKARAREHPARLIQRKNASKSLSQLTRRNEVSRNAKLGQTTAVVKEFLSQTLPRDATP